MRTMKWIGSLLVIVLLLLPGSCSENDEKPEVEPKEPVILLKQMMVSDFYV